MKWSAKSVDKNYADGPTSGLIGQSTSGATSAEDHHVTTNCPLPQITETTC